MSFDRLEEEQTVVIDNGSGSIKAGISGTERPSAIIPSIVGTPKYTRVMVRNNTNEKYYGNEALKYRGICKLVSPIQKGSVVDEHFNDMTQLWEYMYKNAIKKPSEDYPVLLTERSDNPMKNRMKIASLFFEQFNTPALYFAPTAVLSLVASGRLNGCVLDSGAGITTCVPIYEGFALPHAIKRIELGGNDIDKYFEYLLNKNGLRFHTSSELQTIRIIKEKHCELQINSSRNQGLSQRNNNFLGMSNLSSIDMNDEDNNSPKYILPDGTEIILGQTRFNAPEILFDPSKIGLEYDGIHECILNSVMKSDLDLRKQLLQSIVLSGGNTSIKNFGRRLVYELQQKSKKSKIKVYGPGERSVSAWVGGSLLSSLPQFRKMLITKKEYNDDKNVLFRKSFY